MARLVRLGRNLHRDESGATAIEYGFLAALIAVAILASLSMLGSGLSTKYQGFADQFQP